MSSNGIDILVEVLSNVLLFLLIFGMSATVDSGNLKKQLHNRYAICIGLFMQFLIMPFLGFMALKSLGERISPSMGIILLVVTSSPGGSYSNWWCSLFNADLALSVAMTALSTLCSTFLLPVNLLLFSHATYGRSQESILNNINWGTLFISLSIVIVAIITGLVASNTYKTKMFRRWSNRFGSISGLALVIFSMLMNTLSKKDDDGSSNRIWAQDWAFYVGVSLPCILGLLLSNLFSYAARLSPAERVTLSVECCYQNVGIATSVAVAMFDDNQQRAEALGVPLLYGLVEAVVLALYCLIAWKWGWTKAPKDEKMCVMLVNSYEVSCHDDDSTPDIENNQMGSIANLSLAEELQEMQIPLPDIDQQKKRGDSVDTAISTCTTVSSSTSSGTPAREFDTRTIHPGRTGIPEHAICTSPAVVKQDPLDPTNSARRRTSPFVTDRKK